MTVGGQRLAACPLTCHPRTTPATSATLPVSQYEAVRDIMRIAPHVTHEVAMTAGCQYLAVCRTVLDSCVPEARVTYEVAMTVGCQCLAACRLTCPSRWTPAHVPVPHAGRCVTGALGSVTHGVH